MKIKYIFVAAMLLCFATALNARTIRVLAIGNSFSVDAVEQYLYELALAQGDTLIIGNAYIGGCSLERHLDNAHTGKADYSYRKVVDGHKTTTDNVDLATMIADEPWDIITLQQASHDSGQKASYKPLRELKDYVTSTMPNKKAKILWHKTWSYSKDATHWAFPRYGSNQSTMNDSIDAAVKECVPAVGITEIIPSGDAITNGRATFGDVMNRDGFHLDYNLGRYVAACTWCEALTGKSVVGNPYHPATISPLQARSAQQSAHRAFK